MTSVDKYLDRTYHRRDYNCGHFVADVWRDLTGVDISAAVCGLWAPTGQGRASLKQLRAFKRLREPVSPCIALLSPPRGQTHVGIYLRGRILHINPPGVSFDLLEVATLGFAHTRYYECVTD